jgi:hypothetical protein
MEQAAGSFGGGSKSLQWPPGPITPEVAETLHERVVESVRPRGRPFGFWQAIRILRWTKITLLLGVLGFLLTLHLSGSAWIGFAAAVLVWAVLVRPVWRRLFGAPPMSDEVNEFLAEAQVVPGFPLMATGIAKEPGFDTASALVLVNFEDPEMDLSLAAAILSGADETVDDDPTVPDVAPAAANLVERMMADQQFVPHQRVPIPTPGGEPIHALHQIVVSTLHPGGYLRPGFEVIMTLAEPGSRGRCVPLPWWLVTGTTPGKHDPAVWRHVFHEMIARPVPEPPAWLALHEGRPAVEIVEASRI